MGASIFYILGNNLIPCYLFRCSTFRLVPVPPLTYSDPFCFCYLLLLLLFRLFVFSTSLFSGTVRCSGLILYFLSSGSEISHLSKEPWFLLLGNGIWKPKSECYVCAQKYFLNIFYQPGTVLGTGGTTAKFSDLTEILLSNGS